MDEIDPGEFSQEALDHARQPRNHGPLREFNGHARITGPCGDTMEFWVDVRDGRVERVSFITDGCAPALASGSVATCLAEGKPLEDAARIGQKGILDALGGLPKEVEHCALLAADTLRAACEDSLVHGEGKKREGCGECSGECSQEFEDQRRLEERLSRVRHKVVVMSGKGGVGKSTIAVNLAVALAMSGKRVGLLDVDIHGPSVPTMLGLEGQTVQAREDELVPLDVHGVKVLSLGLFLASQDDAVIWRGPLKMGVIKQFLKDVAWGDLDYLIVDCPPGTGDEPLSVCQLIGAMDGAVIVTTPQRVATVDVRKAVTFCRQLRVPVFGIVENMSGFVCAHCGELTRIFRSGGGRRIAEDMKVPFLGAIPIDPKIAEACDDGWAFVSRDADSPSAAAMRDIVRPILALYNVEQAKRPLESEKTDTSGEAEKTIEIEESSDQEEDLPVRIAIPLSNGGLSMHFGHCETFALIDVDPAAKKILDRNDVDAPPHQPGLLPKWLAERGVNVVISGGMGRRARDLFEGQGVEVVVGASVDAPEKLVGDYLAGTLESGENICDH